MKQTIALATAVVLMAAASSASATTTPPTEPATAPTAAAITTDQARAAKVGWAHFVATNFATPTSVPAPCPSASAEQLAAALSANALIPTARPHVVTLTRDSVGAGIVVLGCGVDLSRGSDPGDSTDAIVEVTILDGQADYPAYVQRVGGRDTPIEGSVLGGVEFARCRTEPSRCVASWYLDDLVITVRLELSQNDENAATARSVLHAIVPSAVTGLAGVPAPG